MQLDNARHLQSLLLEGVHETPAAPELALESLAGSGAIFRASIRTRTAFAVGFSARAPGDYQLEVRVQSGEAAVRRHLERSLPPSARRELRMRVIGRVTPCSLRASTRPLIPGCSIGHFGGATGSLGAIVWNTDGDALCLSNNHVLADTNNAERGHPIVQPGCVDKPPEAGDVIGHLDDFVTIVGEPTVNYVDAAIAKLATGITHNHNEIDGTRVTQTATITTTPARVVKVGRSTDRTEGQAITIELKQLEVDFETGLRATFADQIEIEDLDVPFCDNGDSGALVIDEEGRAIGLLFARSDVGGENGRPLAYANPIDTVLNRLAVRLAPP